MMVRQAPDNDPANPFMTQASWYRGLCRKLRTPRIPPILHPANKMLGMSVIMSLIISISQGLDYVVRPPETAPTLSIVEQSLTLDFWGVIFLIFSGIALAGNTFQVWPAAIIGHGVLAVNYFVISVGVFWSLAVDWQGYGWNTGVIYLVFSVFHGLVADGCYDEWAREWKRPPPPIVEIKDDDGLADF